MSIPIETIDELLDFIDTNYERLTEKAYNDLIWNTMSVFIMQTPKNKKEALTQIEYTYNWIQSYPSTHELPLFIEKN